MSGRHKAVKPAPNNKKKSPNCGTRGPAVNNQYRSPLENYNRLLDHEQYITYCYKQYLDTNGQEGWCHADAGCVLHWRHYDAIADLYKTSGSFRTKGIVSSFYIADL